MRITGAFELVWGAARCEPDPALEHDPEKWKPSCEKNILQ